MGSTMYIDGTYAANHPTWHSEDAAWKAKQISQILNKHAVQFRSYVEIGCGSGQILVQLAKEYPEVTFHGYDVSETAINIGRTIGTGDVCLFHKDVLLESGAYYS